MKGLKMNGFGIFAAFSVFLLVSAVVVLSIGVPLKISETRLNAMIQPKQYGQFELEKMGVRLTTSAMKVTLNGFKFQAKTEIKIINTWLNIIEPVSISGNVRVVQEGGRLGSKKVFLDMGDLEAQKIPKSISTLASNVLREKMKTTPIYTVSPWLSKLVRNVIIKNGQIEIEVGFDL